MFHVHELSSRLSPTKYGLHLGHALHGIKRDHQPGGTVVFHTAAISQCTGMQCFTVGIPPSPFLFLLRSAHDWIQLSLRSLLVRPTLKAPINRAGAQNQRLHAHSYVCVLIMLIYLE